MMDFRLIDVKSITSNVPRSQFEETELTRLAEMILVCEGVLKPPILKVTGLDSYEVIDGDREYYAAVVAREIDPRKGEMIDALVISPNREEVIRKQLEMLRSLANPVASPSPLPPPALSDQPLLVDMVRRMERTFQERMDSMNKQIGQMSDQTKTAIERFSQALYQEVQKVVIEELVPRLVQAIEETWAKQKMTGKPKIEIVFNGNSAYAKMTVPQLQELAKQKGIKGYSKMRKPDLVALHENFDASSKEVTP